MIVFSRRVSLALFFYCLIVDQITVQTIPVSFLLLIVFRLSSSQNISFLRNDTGQSEFVVFSIWEISSISLWIGSSSHWQISSSKLFLTFLRWLVLIEHIVFYEVCRRLIFRRVLIWSGDGLIDGCFIYISLAHRAQEETILSGNMWLVIANAAVRNWKVFVVTSDYLCVVYGALKSQVVSCIFLNGAAFYWITLFYHRDVRLCKITLLVSLRIWNVTDIFSSRLHSWILRDASSITSTTDFVIAHMSWHIFFGEFLLFVIIYNVFKFISWLWPV